MKRKDCRKLYSFLIEYMEGTLEREISRKFELHITDCMECREFIESYKKCVNLLKTYEVEIPGELEERLWIFIERELKKKRWSGK